LLDGIQAVEPRRSHPVDIAIIGAGNVGQALATSFHRAGHRVTLAAADPEHAATVGATLGVPSAASNRAAVEAAQVVVIAVPYRSAAERVAREIAPFVDGKVIIDVTNPVKATFDGLVTEGGPSGAEWFATWLPTARVVKAFNTLFASSQAEPVLDGIQLDGFVAGDDADAKRVVLELVESIGLRPVDVGPLARARELEALAFANIAIQPLVGNSWHTAWKLVGVPVGAIAPPRAAVASGR
jgi:predicted dinucleotide-binding enzyme